MYVTAAYGKPKLVLLSVLDAEDSPAGLTLETDPTLAAADVKLISDQQALTECAAEHVTFTSGSEAPTPGDTLTGATSTETCVVIGYLLSGGTWGAGTAAGTIWVQSASGALQSENLNNTTSGTDDVMTIGGDLTDQAIDAVGYTIGIGLTSTEMTCRQFNIELRDATATEEYLETFIPGHTIGHPSAEFALANIPGAHKTTIATLASQTSFTLTTGASDDDAYNSWIVIVEDVSTNYQVAAGVVKDYTGSTKTITLSADPGVFTMAATDLITLIPPVGVKGINTGEVVGDGNATPWDGA